jgi:hypothetical protein
MNRLRSGAPLYHRNGKLGSGFDNEQSYERNLSVVKTRNNADEKLEHMRSLQSLYSSGSMTMDFTDVPLSLQAIAGLH